MLEQKKHHEVYGFKSDPGKKLEGTDETPPEQALNLSIDECDCLEDDEGCPDEIDQLEQLEQDPPGSSVSLNFLLK